MEALAEWVIARHRPILIGFVLTVIALALSIQRIEIDDRPVEYFSPRMEFRRDTDFTVENLSSIYQVSYSIGSGESGGISDPSYLKNLERFAQWLRARPEVHHVAVYTDVMKRVNRSMHGDDPDAYKLPTERQLAAQYLLLFEMSLPYGLDLNDQINIDKSATRLNATLEDISFKDLKTLKADSERWLRDNLPAAMQSECTGTGVMFAFISERNIKSMIKGTLIGFALISVLLVFAFRDPKLGALSIIPNLTPVIMAFGIWGLTVAEVGFAVSVVGAIAIGIIVDDTVHFLSKYLRARREQNLSSEDAIRYAFKTVGNALWGTSLILIVGFSLLITSAFWLNATMGILTALTIAAALAADFLFLPSLLISIDSDRSQP